MLECSNIIEENIWKKRGRKIPIRRPNGIVIVTFPGQMDGMKIKELLEMIHFIIHVYKKSCKQIIFSSNGLFKPKDSLVYIMLECILYTLKYKYGYEVRLVLKGIEATANAPGLVESLLLEYRNKEEEQKKIKKHHELMHTRNHFRRVVPAKDISKVSILLGELKIFFKSFFIKDGFGDEISKVISELADNACEHTGTDCLVDVYVSEPTYRKDDGGDEEFYAIGIVVLNFSDKLLHEDIKKKIQNQDYSKSDRYNEVHKAYETHKDFFSKENNYNEEDFFNIAVFQDEISGRGFETESGGTGLTGLIKSLEDKAEAHSCYVLSGKQGIGFEKEYLEYNAKGWIGFNDENDFFHSRPTENAIGRADINFLGTAYNFTLIAKKEEVKEYENIGNEKN